MERKAAGFCLKKLDDDDSLKRSMEIFANIHSDSSRFFNLLAFIESNLSSKGIE